MSQIFRSLLRPPDSVVFFSQGESVLFSRSRGDDFNWTCPQGEARIGPAEDQEGWAIHIFAPEVPLEALVLRWRQPVETGLWLLGDLWERAYGDLEWRGIVPERVMPWYFAASDGDDTYACGVKTGPSAICSWNVDPQGATLTLDLHCGGLGVCLGERTLAAAALVDRESRPGETPFAAVRAFARLLCQDAVTPAEPVYGANDYYYASCENTHEGILRDSAILAELSPHPTNRPYSVVDAGWQWGGEANGSPWHTGNARFPDMPGLAEGLRRAGARPGLWFRPLLTTESLPASWTLPNERFPVFRSWNKKLSRKLPSP